MGYGCFFFLGVGYLVNAWLRFTAGGAYLMWFCVALYGLASVAGIVGIGVWVSRPTEKGLAILAATTLCSTIYRGGSRETAEFGALLSVAQPAIMVSVPLLWSIGERRRVRV